MTQRRKVLLAWIIMGCALVVVRVAISLKPGAPGDVTLEVASVRSLSSAPLSVPEQQVSVCLSNRSRKEMVVVYCEIVTNGASGWMSAGLLPFSNPRFKPNEARSVSLRMAKQGVPWRLGVTLCPVYQKNSVEGVIREVHDWACLHLSVRNRRSERESIMIIGGTLIRSSPKDWHHAVTELSYNAK